MPFDPEAYATDETVVPVQMRHAAPSLRVQQQSRMDAVLDEMQAAEREAAEAAQAQMNRMTEARNRFAKAALYEQLIEGQIFEGDDPVTLQVEEEIKNFVEERLMVLLGMAPEQQKAKAFDILDEDEVTVLKLFAAKMLGRQAAIPKPAVEAVKPQPPKPVLAAPRPVAPTAPAAPSLAAPRRRGRPPGTGKHQRAAAAAAQQVAPPPPAPTPAPAPQRVAPPVPQRTPVPTVDPSATSPGQRTVQLPNGEVRVVSGQTGQAKPVGRRPLPMPSPDEQIAKAAYEGDAVLKQLEQSIRNGDVTQPTVTTMVPQFSQ